MAGAPQGGYNLEEVERVINDLYSNPANVAEANAWLVNFLNSEAAWEISVNLMNSQHQTVKFFCANALHQKIKNDINQLPQPAAVSLLEALLNILKQDLQQQVLTKLSLALVALALHFTSFDGQLQPLLLDNAAFLSLPQAAALEFFLLLPQEWDRWSLTKTRQDKALQELGLLLPRVVLLIQTLLSTATDDITLSRCLQALAGWCKFGMTLSNLKDTPIYPRVQSCLQSPTLGKPACELLEAAVNTETHPPEPDEVLLEVVAQMVAVQALYRQAQQAGNDEYCEGLCSLSRALMLRRPELMASGKGETLALAAWVLEMACHRNRGVSETGMEFFDELQTLPMDERHPDLRQPIFAQLTEAVALHCAPLGSDFTDWDSAGEDDPDDFHMYRRRVEEALLNSCVCLQSGCLTLLCEQLASKGTQSWQLAEGILFSISCIGLELGQITDRAQRELVQNTVAQLLGSYILPQSLPWHPMVQMTALSVMEQYAKFIGSNEALVGPCLELATSKLTDKILADNASKAFRALCSKGAVHLRDPTKVLGLVTIVTQNFAAIPRQALIVVVESLGRVLSGMPGQSTPLLEHLCTPFVVRLKELTDSASGAFIKASTLSEVVHCIQLLAAAIRFLESKGQEGGHPVVGLLGSVWDGLEATRTRFGSDPEVVGALCDVYIKGMKQAREEGEQLLVPLVNAAVGSFRSSRAEQALECISVAVEVFGKVAGAAESFGGLLGELTTVAFEAIQEKGPDSCPELIAALFEMLYRYLLFCPEGLVPHPVFPTCLQLACACLRLRQKDPVRSVLVFLDRLVNLQPPLWDLHVQAWMDASGEALYQGVIFALADSCPSEALPRLSPLLYALNARFGATAGHWLQRSLLSEQFPCTLVDSECKQSFVTANQKLSGNARRFQALVQDFAQICRRQQTADALIAYQM